MSDPESERFRQLLDLMPVMVVFIDRDGMPGWGNHAFRTMFPRSDSMQPGPATTPRLFPFSDNIAELVRNVPDTGSAVRGIVETVENGDGEVRTLKIDLLPFSGPEGTGQAILFATDITEQAVLEHMKKEAYGQIEKNIEQFAILGDQIRNPLAVITGLSDLLDETAVGEKILAQAREIDRIVDRIDRGWIESEKVRAMIRKYYDVGVSGTHELVARAIHEEYLAHRETCGQTPEIPPALCPWNELPRNFQEANLRQADDIWKKLSEIHCVIGIATESRIAPFEFTADEIELLARNEHERWMDERIRNGWIYGPAVNAQKRVHHCIVRWEQLPEEQKEKDRNAIRTLPKILGKVRLKIIRLNR